MSNAERSCKRMLAACVLLLALSASSAARAAAAQEAHIAFFVQISNETVRHLPRLLSRIHHAHNLYAVHIDRKVPSHVRRQAQQQLYAANARYGANVFFMHSEHVTYRGISMVLNTLNAMDALLRRRRHWHYLINLSGSDYPLVSSHDMRRLLGEYKQQQLNFLTLGERALWARNRRHRLRTMHIDPALSFGGSRSAALHTLAQPNPLSAWFALQYTTGEAWMIASRQLCEVATRSPFARKLLLSFAVSADASEHFFATLVANHAALRASLVPHALRQVFWTLNGTHSGQHPFYVDGDAASAQPALAPRLLQRSPNLFIRKFRQPDSPLMALADALQRDGAHLARVREHLRWAVQRARARE